jgi:hypothetical protein
MLMNRYMQHNLVVNPVMASNGGFISGGPVSETAVDMRPSASRSNSPSDGSTHSASGRNDGFQSLTSLGNILLSPSVVSGVKGMTLTDSAVEMFPGKHVFEGQYV